MKILILGADGYLGWPTTLHFADQGHKVIALDNYSKRKLLYIYNCGSESLWKRSTNDIKIYNFEEIDIAKNYVGLEKILEKNKPDIIIHYAEQPSAPYSMLSHATADYTIQNNIRGTLNLIHAIKETELDCHLIKFGSMGEYGTPNVDIEEGWLNVNHKGRKEQFLYPRSPGSLYHATKVFDTDMLWFYSKQWGLKVTDIMQGVIYGITTPEIEKYNMPTNFYYDDIFGTVINRFIIQAIAGYPLTIYGEGGQQRTFLNLKDVMKCLEIVIAHPPPPGEMQIINQFSDICSIQRLANDIRKIGNEEFNLDVKIEHHENLRQEKMNHYFWPKKDKLEKWGLRPQQLYSAGIREMFQTLLPYKDQINKDIIYKGVKWK